VSRGGRLTAKLDVENRFYREIHADVRRYVSSRRPVAAAAAVLLLIALGAGLYFGLSLGSESAGEPGAASTRGPAAAETPSEPGSEQARPEQPGSAQADSQPSGDRAVEEASEAPAEARPDAGRSGADSAAVAPASWTVYFLPDSPVLTPQTRSSLDRVAEELSRLPEEATVRIVGHTALAGTEQGRIGLSRDRARNVYRYLQEQGWTPRQEVTVRGVGGNEPVTRDPDRQEQNRRVEIRVEG
jgi:outer membrane protein OmpA-like peptidoglycan-associated protein